MTSSTIDRSLTLADLAVTRAGASRVFHRLGLDFCCHGQRSLEDACAERGLDVGELVAALEAEEAPADAPFERWDEGTLDDLIEHVLARFHEPHRAELPRLLEMAQKVERVHGDKAACPRGLAQHLEELATELEQHMQKEEQVLFPLVRSGRGRMAQMPIHVMEEEHKDAGQALARTRELCTDFVAPDEACGTWRALYLGLAELERDLMEHIHLENNVLFPRALRG